MCREAKIGWPVAVKRSRGFVLNALRKAIRRRAEGKQCFGPRLHLLGARWRGRPRRSRAGEYLLRQVNPKWLRRAQEPSRWKAGLAQERKAKPAALGSSRVRKRRGQPAGPAPSRAEL